MIFLSVLPLLKDSAMTLLLQTPSHIQYEILDRILKLDQVLSYSDEHFWNLSSSMVVGTIHIQIASDGDEQRVTAQVGLDRTLLSVLITLVHRFKPFWKMLRFRMLPCKWRNKSSWIIWPVWIPRLANYHIRREPSLVNKLTMKLSFHPTALFLVKPPFIILEYERLFLWRTLFSLFLVSRCSLLNLFHLDIQYKKK